MFSMTRGWGVVVLCLAYVGVNLLPSAHALEFDLASPGGKDVPAKCIMEETNADVRRWCKFGSGRTVTVQ